MKVGILCILSFSIIVIACTNKEKNEPTYQLANTYVFETAEYSDFKGFIKGRELTSKETQDFINNERVLQVSTNKSPVSDTIFFKEDNKVKYSKDPDVFSWKFAQSKNTIILKTDTIWGPPNCSSLHNCVIFNNILVWKRDSVGSIYLSGAGYRSLDLYRKEYTLERDRLIIPLIVFKYVYHPIPGNLSMRSFRLENKFDKNVVKDFLQGDTLAIMEGKVIFKKLN